MSGKTILVGICGGVAAYKALDVVSALTKAGHKVRVAMTEAACQFVNPATFAAVSAAPVLRSLWQEGQGEDLYPHLYPSTRADLCLILPATANTIAKIAYGLGDDLLSTACLSLPPDCTCVFCPSMNSEMWRNPVVQENTARLEARGWLRIGPAEGRLACGVTGPGRLTEPAEILDTVLPLLVSERPLAGKRLLILSGPTHEYLDPVRFLGNASSGLMGKALAETARLLGAEVTLISGPVPAAHLPAGIRTLSVVSAEEMLAAARTEMPRSDAAIFAAAVADYRPARRSPVKESKSEAPVLTLVTNPDLAATLGREFPRVFRIGFALQSHDGETCARGKLEAKNLQGIVLNAPDSLGADSGEFHYLAAGAESFTSWGRLSKPEAARRILAQIRLPNPA